MDIGMGGCDDKGSPSMTCSAARNESGFKFFYEAIALTQPHHR